VLPIVANGIRPNDCVRSARRGLRRPEHGVSKRLPAMEAALFGEAAFRLRGWSQPARNPAT